MPVIGRHGDPPFGEDCLTLNVWTPGLDDARRPVLVWIHGGGFLSGSGNIPYYAADTFARNGDLVGISINYRVGALGFLAGMGDENVWLSDQVAALQWIVDNVAAFGGDPSSITLAGQSGGALSIAALAQHPVAGRLFHRAILQSPPLGLELPPPHEEGVERTRSLARHLGHTDVEALREEPWERLIEGTLGVLTEFAEFGEWDLAYFPVIDEATLPRHPLDGLGQTDHDLIVGWTADEATFAFGVAPSMAEATAEQVVTWIGKRHGDRAAALYETYAADAAKPGDVVSRMITDQWFRGAGLRIADDRSTTRPVRAYQFGLRSPMLEGALGSTHCLELPFTFANIERWSGAPLAQGFDPRVVAQVTDLLHRAWIGFARNGDPVHDGLPEWPAYRTNDPAILTVTEETAVARDLARPPVCS